MFYNGGDDRSERLAGEHFPINRRSIKLRYQLNHEGATYEMAVIEPCSGASGTGTATWQLLPPSNFGAVSSASSLYPSISNVGAHALSFCDQCARYHDYLKSSYLLRRKGPATVVKGSERFKLRQTVPRGVAV